MRWASEQQQRSLRTYIGVALLLACARGVRADGTIDAWASWALAPKVWKGQTVLAPEPTPRPAGPFVPLDSLWVPVRVHVPSGMREVRAQRFLAATEHAYEDLLALRWPLPSPDAGRGGNTNADLYLVARSRCDAACSGVDSSAPLSDFDAADTYALISDDLPSGDLEACAISALAQAGLRAVDPAEAESWVRASAELAVWLGTGRAGCAGSLASGQTAPERGILNAEPSSGDAGALFLGMLTERVEEASAATPGTWLRNLWETTRQRSTGLVAADRLRSSPDLWEALAKTLELQHVTLDDELIEFGVARYFAGPAARRAQAAYRLFSALPSDAGVPLASEVTRLPAHLRDRPPLASTGSAYVRVLLPGPARSQQLQIWLHGEQGPRWSLTAVRLDANGRELGRIAAPARNVPSAYIPLVLDDETREVVAVVTALPEKLPDADRADGLGHGYELIVSE